MSVSETGSVHDPTWSSSDLSAPSTNTSQGSDIHLIRDEKKALYPYKSVAVQVDLEAARTPDTLPDPKKKRFAPIRFVILNIYRRLFSLVFLANIATFIAIMTTERKLLGFVNAAAANLLVCGLARQPLVVNSIFVSVCSIPRSAPMWLRRFAAKVYHYGGVHSGCGIASLVWYAGFIGLLSRQYFAAGGAPGISTAAVVLSYVILGLLVAIILAAFPMFRFKRHDYFELTHRFSSWLVLSLFWALIFVFSEDARKASHQSLGQYLIRLPAFWFLIVVIVAIIHPWAMLRKVPVPQAEQLSKHAVRLHFDYTTTAFGKGIQLAKHPLRDWHAFATFPDPDGQTFSALVSRAGDWTSDTIQNPPTHLWKRGVLIYGFAYAMRVFRRVLVVTTGSGIGPCLSFLGDENRPELRVVWQTRSPLQTYGQGVLDLVARMDSNAVILDTSKTGRTDMTPLIQQLAAEFEAEAVCVISNPVLTKKLVYNLEARGVPAYGPIFDS
ncbi:hypothetical protein DTO166G4_3297 [Paecilomyces variotii]|uniref:Integral membrane protein TmpA n=1 Tax=Byssochlamys spectabilis TaxID=264951 RepID=A0A443I153_BYSSP|nr:integral membrane protein TmpA [Paecilomyces variotii]KAJ9200297.1 hypothetical protein DTO032I3_4603 [Paecilomyces variotii]KAJ9202564.1 hypothetical protein DTO164E3_3004 [Paecilomyces variotii]KAJ9215040.1 hypothetical protein DTO166G4_3297 [Paecilomyces variotii]KAJ9224555.1 hypothetical protein DTO169C6_3104 [Paecilomyces variotii]KAJ9239119.1 hypothetical protein DTO166G5_2649 [Paecilomyces variotii]